MAKNGLRIDFNRWLNPNFGSNLSSNYYIRALSFFLHDTKDTHLETRGLQRYLENPIKYTRNCLAFGIVLKLVLGSTPSAHHTGQSILFLLVQHLFCHSLRLEVELL